jgi:hypothetical protein
MPQGDETITICNGVVCVSITTSTVTVTAPPGSTVLWVDNVPSGGHQSTTIITTVGASGTVSFAPSPGATNYVIGVLM